MIEPLMIVVMGSVVGFIAMRSSCRSSSSASWFQAQLEGTPQISSIAWDGDTIQIPGAADSYIALDTAGARFRAIITNHGQKVRVKVIGRYGSTEVGRGVQMDYALAEKASSIFDFGVASRGKVTVDGQSRVRGATDPTKGSILSTTMSDPTPVVATGKEVSGDISITNPNGNVTIGSSTSVGGTNNLATIYAEHIHKGVPEPEFPTLDVSAFLTYATNTYTGGSTIINAVIPPNTNPTFAGGATLQGVIVLQSPNTVTFRGNCNLQGVIVVENDSPGDLSTNILDFRGSINASGVETLPEEFGDLRKLTGAVIIAPNFHTKFSGNFGEINGHIMSSKFTFDGNASGTIKGSIINLDDNAMLVKGSSEIIIASTGTTNYPAGVFFSSHYVPLPDTYEEVQP
jgi:hypothetical protein